MTLQQYLSYRRTQPPRPAITHEQVRARGLVFAVYRTPAVDGALPLLCINGGLLFDYTLLWPALAPLAQRRQLIFFDQRGRGATQPAPGLHNSRIEFDAGDVSAIREALGIERWNVLGHSWGGGIAMLAVAQDNAAVERLVLVNSVGIDSRWLHGLHQDALDRLEGEWRETLSAFDVTHLQHSSDVTLHSAYAKAFFPAWFSDREFAAAVRPPHGDSRTGAVIASRLRRDGYDWTSQLGDLQTPTLVVHGADDVLPLAEAERTASFLRNARLQVIPAAGHNPFWESPALFFDCVDTFLDASPTTERRS